VRIAKHRCRRERADADEDVVTSPKKDEEERT